MSKLDNNELAIIYLDYVGVSRKRILELLRYTTKPYDEICKESLSVDVREILGKEKAEKLEEFDVKKSIKNLKLFLEEENISVVTILGNNFPKNLINIPDPPIIIYYNGDISLLNQENLLAVVGTRKPTAYGRAVAEKFVSELVLKGNIVTVSGLAYGIDSEVARVTLENKGKTIAVLGGGIRQIYPASNTTLAEKIVETGGLVMSEYFPTARPTQYTFPERNRIVSGVSKGVLVIEAGEKSGSLITANFAIEQGKELFVVPGNINNVNCFGSNKLIEDLPYTFTSSTKNIFKLFGINELDKKDSANEHQYSIEEQRVVDALSSGEKTVDELCEILKEDFKTINILLTEMEISGIIKKLTGDYYSI